MTLDSGRNRKHLARAERDRRLQRYVLIGVAIVAIAVIGVIGYGWYDINVVQRNRPLITVNGEQVDQATFQARVALVEAQLVRQYQDMAALGGFIGTDPNATASLQRELGLLESQLSNPVILGQQVLEQMIRDLIIKQEAERRGLTISEDGVERKIEETFGFFRDGTPTPGPTRTPFPTLTANPNASETPTAAATEAETATPGATPTNTEIPADTPTPTPYTQDIFDANYASYVASLGQYDISEQNFRDFAMAEVYREALIASFEDEVPHEQEQVRARHILVDDVETAQEVLDRLAAGDAWEALALEYSTDESNRALGGDLGWFGRGRMVEAFEAAAFDAEAGSIVGPVETSFGFHLIEVLEHADRELTAGDYQTALQAAFDDWLSEARRTAEVDVLESWPQVVPTVQGFLPGGGL